MANRYHWRSWLIWSWRLLVLVLLLTIIGLVRPAKADITGGLPVWVPAYCTTVVTNWVGTAPTCWWFKAAATAVDNGGVSCPDGQGLVMSVSGQANSAALSDGTQVLWRGNTSKTCNTNGPAAKFQALNGGATANVGINGLPANFCAGWGGITDTATGWCLGDITSTDDTVAGWVWGFGVVMTLCCFGYFFGTIVGALERITEI